MIHKTLDSHQFENPESRPSSGWEALQHCFPSYGLQGLHPSMLCQMGFFVLSVSTAHRHGFSISSFRTVQQYWATLRKPLCDPSSFPKTRLRFDLVWFLTFLLCFHRLTFCGIVFQGDHSYKQSKDTEERLKVIPKFCFPDSKNWVPTSELKR